MSTPSGPPSARSFRSTSSPRRGRLRRNGSGSSPGHSLEQDFRNEVTLAAPALFAAALPQASQQMVMTATTAHMLAVIAAFATDRLLDRQAESNPLMLRVLEHVRLERDRAICELTGSEVSPYQDAEYGALCAINTERILLDHGIALSFSDYCQPLAGQAGGGLPRVAGPGPGRGGTSGTSAPSSACCAGSFSACSSTTTCWTGKTTGTRAARGRSA